MNTEQRIVDAVRRAMSWVREHTVPGAGVMVSSAEPFPYLEVTGYFIPTLLTLGEESLARQYADFLQVMQRPDGAFAGPDGKEYFFDTAQVLRGLLAAGDCWPEFLPAARSAARYLASRIKADGSVEDDYAGTIPMAVILFGLVALRQAGKLLGEEPLAVAAERACAFHEKQADPRSQDILLHFQIYMLDGLFEMGREAQATEWLGLVVGRQRLDGSVSAYRRVSWTCSVGVAQLALLACKAGMTMPSDNALSCLCRWQNKSGGFYGSYGWGAGYFQRAEISWAVKFFLDAAIQRCGAPALTSPRKALTPLDAPAWATAITAGQQPEHVAQRIRRNDVSAWGRELLKETAPGDVVLELGCGTGELSAVLALYGRQVQLLDFAKGSLNHAGQVFASLNLQAVFHQADILQGIPLPDNSVDIVFSSGLLEHFTDAEILVIMKESARVARKAVIALVPNARALAYRVGKMVQEREGRWPWGLERPVLSLVMPFAAAGLVDIREWTVAPYQALAFLPSLKEAKTFYQGLSRDELESLGQGYLLCVRGHKKETSAS